MDPHDRDSDNHLALRTSEGDRDAFAALYNRHFRAVYDLIYRMLRDEEVAADTAQNTFIRAWENLQKRQVSGNVRAWLLTIARNTALNEIRRRKRWRALAASEPEGGDPLVLEAIDTSRLSNPEAVVDDQELVDLVWNSAAALGPKDYSLLDLHLRKDLSPRELASGLGLSSARVHVMLSRLRDTLEESVAVSLLARRGRGDCPQLGEILAGASGAGLSPRVRLEVRRHLKECELCAESRKRFVAPAEIFSGLALIPVSDAVPAVIWARISPLLLPGAGSLGFLAAAVDRLGHWWAEAGVGVKAASIAALATVVVLPIGVSIIVVSTSGANDSAGSNQTSGGVGLISSPTKTSLATAAPGETHTPTPVAAGVAASPAPGEATGADVTVVSVGLTSSGGIAGQQFLLSATALLRNLGGASSVLVDTGFALTAPAGCSSSPAATVTVQDKTLPPGSDVSITRAWSVTCASPGDHSFGVGASAAIDPSQPLTDPNPGNNANSGSLGVTVLP